MQSVDSVRAQNPDQWYEFNDATVVPLRDKYVCACVAYVHDRVCVLSVVTPEAYLLLYERLDGNVPASVPRALATAKPNAREASTAPMPGASVESIHSIVVSSLVLCADAVVAVAASSRRRTRGRKAAAVATATTAGERVKVRKRVHVLDTLSVPFFAAPGVDGSSLHASTGSLVSGDDDDDDATASSSGVPSDRN
jgi:hypothetical protein